MKITGVVLGFFVMPFAPRKKLPHDVPFWVRSGSLFFVTLCALPRGVDSLCRPEVAPTLHPTKEHNLLVDMILAKLTAIMSSLELVDEARHGSLLVRCQMPFAGSEKGRGR